VVISGVAPPRFDYPGNVDVWTPTVFDFEVIPKRGALIWQTIGRLKSGVTMNQARQQFKAEVSRVSPDGLRREDNSSPELVGLRDQLSAQIRQSVLILFAVVLLVLLTACANVAQLLLSRTAERHQELALRSALGASRSRLIQQLTVEGMALTLTGSALGMIVAFLVSRTASAILPAQLATQNYTLLDWHVLCFAVTLALIAGAVFGIMPVWLIGRIQPSTQFVRVHPGTSERVTTSSTSLCRRETTGYNSIHRRVPAPDFPRRMYRMVCHKQTFEHRSNRGDTWGVEGRRADTRPGNTGPGGNRETSTFDNSPWMTLEPPAGSRF
jgi:hypothetical protein